MKKICWSLAVLAACQQHPAEHQAPATATATKAPATRPAVPATAYTSGNRAVSGPLDTLQVGQDHVLRLVPGRKSDFNLVARQLPFSEVRLVRQQGDGRVRRVEHPLIVRPFSSSVLGFTDNTYQIQHDNNEETDSQCRFLGSVPGRPYWLADSILWEHSQPFLISKQSGCITLLN